MKEFLERAGIVFLSILMVFTLASCGDDDDETEETQQFSQNDIAVTGTATEIGMTYATVSGYVNIDRIPYGSTLNDIGIVVSTNEKFPSEETLTISVRGIEGNKFTVNLQKLDFGTTYYYKTYVKCGNLYFYGKTQSLVTKELTAQITASSAREVTFTSAAITLGVNNASLPAAESVYVGLAYSEDKQLLKLDSLFAADNIQGVHFAYSIDIPCSSLKDNTLAISLNELKPGHTYYYCAYLIAGKKVVSSEIRNFSTLQFQSQQLMTNDVTDVSLTTAKVSGTTTLASALASLYPAGMSITYGISYAPESDFPNWSEDDFEEHTLISSYSSVSSVATLEGKTFTSKLEHLQPNTTYLYQAYIRIGITDVLTGKVKRYTTKDLNNFISTEVKEIGINSARIAGKSLLNGLYSNVKYTLHYQLAGENGWDRTVEMTEKGDSISATLSVYNSKKYEYWINVQADNMSMNTNVKTFETLNPRDFITIYDATNVTANSAVLKFSVDPRYCDDYTSGYFYYGLTRDNLSNVASSQLSGTSGTATLHDLRPGTTYYYSAHVLIHLGIGSADWFESDIKSFTTPSK